MDKQKITANPLHDDFQFVNVSRLMTKKKSVATRKQMFEEIYYPYSPKQAQSQAHRCIDCGNPYCEWKCPVHNYIPDWLRLINQGKIIEAAELCHQTNSLPEVCGRICPQDRLCEGACTLNDDFGAVTIGALEKHITETAFNMGWRPDLSQVVKRKQRVAIIGAGPAGLACADVLVRNGITPVVFDRYPEIGGLLTFGIPEFKLEKSVMQRRKTIFSDMGVQFQLNTNVGTDIAITTLLEEFDAIFIGMGVYKALHGNFPGENIKGVYPPLPYLIGNTCHIHSFHATPEPFISLKDKKVIVLGGGDTAMDCNRTAIRQGAKQVTCIYRRTEEDMPGSRSEVKHAKEEGVNFLFNRQPVAINGNRCVTGITCLHTRIDANSNLPHDKTIASNRRAQYTTIPNSEETIEADAVIIAFGFQASPAAWFDTANINTIHKGLIQVNHSTHYPFQTSNPKIFAGGDMIRGADLVVTAIADGRGAAEDIITYLDRQQ